jgi:sodium pump decarboxylase gamma subunit
MNKPVKSIIKGICLFAFIWCGTLSAQNADKLRINEVMLDNQTSYTDESGNRTAWIEIFNTAYFQVGLGGCYLTDDINEPRKFLINKSNMRSKIPMRQFIVFFADGKNAINGAMHLPFTLEKRFIALFDANGKLIDSMSIPQSLPTDISYGRQTDGGAELGMLQQSTPAANNKLPDADRANKRLKINDPTGGAMTIISMGVVFIALALLFYVFKTIGKYHVNRRKKRAIKTAQAEGKAVTEATVQESGEIYAAIALALALFENDAHDFENTILTIDKVERRYSPWSSKIYNLRENPKIQGKTNSNKKK